MRLVHEMMFQQCEGLQVLVRFSSQSLWEKKKTLNFLFIPFCNQVPSAGGGTCACAVALKGYLSQVACPVAHYSSDTGFQSPIQPWLLFLVLLFRKTAYRRGPG